VASAYGGYSGSDPCPAKIAAVQMVHKNMIDKKIIHILGEYIAII